VAALGQPHEEIVLLFGLEVVLLALDLQHLEHPHHRGLFAAQLHVQAQRMRHVAALLEVPVERAVQRGPEPHEQGVDEVLLAAVLELVVERGVEPREQRDDALGAAVLGEPPRRLLPILRLRVLVGEGALLLRDLLVLGHPEVEQAHGSSARDRNHRAARSNALTAPRAPDRSPAPVRKWWNWQTRRIQDPVPRGMGVRLPPSALTSSPQRERTSAPWRAS
jgi:hypothetical protein